MQRTLFGPSTVSFIATLGILGATIGIGIFTRAILMDTPVHVLVALGMPILDSMDLQADADVAAKLNRWDFLSTAGSLRVPQGTGSPLNAIATF